MFRSRAVAAERWLVIWLVAGVVGVAGGVVGMAGVAGGLLHCQPVISPCPIITQPPARPASRQGAGIACSGFH